MKSLLAVATVSWEPSHSTSRFIECRERQRTSQRGPLLERGNPYAASEARAIRAFLSRGLGTPDEPGNADHLQGLVAEHLWHMSHSEAPSDEPVLYLSTPKFDPTGPGADGLVIFDDQSPRFRLWEIKKSGAQFSQALSKAYGQLAESGDVYLAQLTEIGQEFDGGRLASVFAQLLDWWIDGAEQANAGVAIASPVHPTNSFTTMRTRIPELTGAVAHRGLFFSIEDYAGFCSAVRTTLWIGL